MPPLEIFNGRAFLISPLDIPVYIFKIPVVREERREEEVGKCLWSLYPGNPGDTFIDYKLSRRENPKWFNVTAVACPGTVYESYRRIRKPLVPGIFLMSSGVREIAGPAKTAILFTSRWIEIACFEKEEPVRYASCKRDSLSFIASFCGEKEAGDGTPRRNETALLINAEPESDAGKDIQELLRDKFTGLTLVPTNDLKIRKRLKTIQVFNNRNHIGIKNRKKLIHALLILNGISLALVLLFVSSRLNLRLQAVQKGYEEQKTYQEEERRLLKEIAALRSRLPDKTAALGIPAYELISEIRNSLSRGWIRSLTIQDRDLSLEAEGTDSLSAARALEDSPVFSDLLIKRAVPSEHSGELFTISGRIRYGKE
jgi:hypothetical protein